MELTIRNLDLQIKDLLKLNHMSRAEARYMGLLSKCPLCKKLLIRHPNVQYQGCLTQLAIKMDKTYNRNKLRKNIVKELQDGKIK